METEPTEQTIFQRAGNVIRRILPAVAILLVASACSGAAETATGTTTADETTSTTQSTQVEESTSTTASDASDPATTEPIEVDPDAPAASQLDWFVSKLNAEEGLSGDELSERFAPEFLAQIPASQIVSVADALFGQLATPFTVENFVAADDAGTAGTGTIVSADGEGFSANIAVSPVEPHQIIGLLIQPAAMDPVTVDEAEAAMAALGSVSAAGIYDVSQGTCDVVDEIDGDQAIPIGSAFKLWVLAELADRIEAGDAAWDEEIEIVDALKSSPDGEFFSVPSGETATVVDLATAMIETSDNTATDHLMDRLGRTEVEAAMDRIGIADPSANTPMLSTGNLFALKFVAAAPNYADYRDLDQAGKRELLEQLDAATLAWVADPANIDLVNADGVAISDPRDLDLEWFATPRDLCLTLVYLSERAERAGLEPVADILEANPGQGIPFDRDRFPIIRFKGGSEPGVIAGAWWFERSDGQRFVVAGGVSDPDQAFDELEAIMAVASLVTIVA